MNEMIEFLTSKEIVVVYIVVAVACLLCFVIYLIDKSYYKRKQRQNTRELNKIVESVNETIEPNSLPDTKETYQTPVLEKIEELDPEPKITPVMEEKKEVQEQPVIQPIISNSEEKEVENLVLESMPEKTEETLTYTEVEPNPEEAQEALRKLTEELEKAEQENPNNIDLTSYEVAQEENAIISLEELLKKSKEMYESNEVTQYADEGNEPISIQDLEARMNQLKQEELTSTETTPEIIQVINEKEPEQLVLDDFNTVGEEKIEKPAYQSSTKFHSSPVISPIYGIEKTDRATELELENTANYDKLDEEIKKTNEFLMTLKELQKHLD